MANVDDGVAHVHERALSLVDGALDEAHRLDARLGGLVQVREALGQLRNLTSVSQLSQRAPIELCERCGFDRALFSRVEDGEMVAQSAFFARDSDWCEAFLRTAWSNPLALRQPLAEAEVVRQRRAMVILDPLHDPRALCHLMQEARPTSYVVAPVVCDNSVVGMLHADRFGSGHEVDGTDRDVLWAFAEGFGYALERVRLLERLHEQRARVMRSLDGDGESDGERSDPLREMARDVEARAEEFEDVRLDDLVSDSEPIATGLPLTRREFEVLHLIAAGATNQRIADALVISEQTVKSHVKNILRKLGAANRTEAASRLGPAALR